jgi:hypothetical protein
MKRTCVAIIVEGVLQQIVGGDPIREGVGLYNAFDRGDYDIVLVSPNALQAKLIDWLWHNGFSRHSVTVFSLEEARRKGYTIDLVVTSNPNQARSLFELGITTLLFSHPSYQMPEWRPDYKHPDIGWNELSREVAAEAERKLADHRTDDVAA